MPEPTDWSVAPTDRGSSSGVALLKLVGRAAVAARRASVRAERRCDTCAGPHGRPRIVDSDLHVSVAHAGALVAVALTRAGPVGVDVQDRAVRTVMPLARDVLADCEPVARPEDLLTYWCRKESLVKATGEGLRAPLREVVVSPAPDAARVVSYRGCALPAQMADLEVGDGYAAAVTVLTAELARFDVRPGNELVGAAVMAQ